MSETVKLSLAQYFGEDRGFRARFLASPDAGRLPEVEDPYARGLADGQQMAEAAFSVERKQLHALLVSADALRPEDNAEIGFMLDNIIRKIVEKIVGSSEMDAAFLAQQIADATAALTEADQNRTLRLHPDDLALLAGADLPLHCVPDAQLPRGGLRIECSDGWIEHGPAFALERLVMAFSDDGSIP